jgi:hypothetical protein
MTRGQSGGTRQRASLRHTRNESASPAHFPTHALEVNFLFNFDICTLCPKAQVARVWGKCQPRKMSHICPDTRCAAKALLLAGLVSVVGGFVTPQARHGPLGGYARSAVERAQMGAPSRTTVFVASRRKTKSGVIGVGCLGRPDSATQSTPQGSAGVGKDGRLAGRELPGEEVEKYKAHFLEGFLLRYLADEIWKLVEAADGPGQRKPIVEPFEDMIESARALNRS